MMLAKRGALGAAAVLMGIAAVVACGKDSVPEIAPADPYEGGNSETSVADDGAVAADGVTSSDGSAITDGAVAETSTNPDTGPTGPCPADTLCFDVTPVNAGQPALPGRLAIIWYQLDDDGPDPIYDIGYDIAFTGAEKRVDIPLASIKLPTEQNLLCQRACNDESTCPCLSDPKVGTGVVVVAYDNTGKTQLDVTMPYVGVARMGLGYSANAVAAPAPSPFDRLFPDGIQQGVHGYSLVRPEAGVFDRFGASPAGTIYTLSVCDSADAAVCDLPFPNFT